MMGSVRQKFIQDLWGGHDPFSERSAFRGRVDFQGWASTHGYLPQCIQEIAPQCVIEVGVWKGGSTLTMAEQMRTQQLDSVIISVDTWLGASEHWTDPAWFKDLRFEAGYPSLFKTFAANVLERGLEGLIVPLPLDSLNAAQIMKMKGIRPQILHIDGGHDFASVTSDLRVWWPLLAPGGILIGDDYHPEGINVWPEVRAAFHEFFNTNAIENRAGKCLIRKPS